jgi:putative redox protein
MTTPRTPSPKARRTEQSGTPHREPNRIVVQWQGARRFEAGRPGGPAVRVDGDAEIAPSPVDMLLGALATCASVDVVDILAKRRTPVATLEVEVEGTRADGTPRRLTHVLLAFRITGDGIEREQAERAIELSITKYCSVRDSLDPDLPIDWTLTLDGAPASKTSG